MKVGNHVEEPCGNRTMKNCIDELSSMFLAIHMAPSVPFDKSPVRLVKSPLSTVRTMNENCPDIVYYHPDDYYVLKSKSVSGTVGKVKAWTEAETVIFYGIRVAMYYAAGTKVVKTSDTPVFRERSQAIVYEACWKRVRNRVQVALEKYSKISGEKDFLPFERSWKECANHFAVMMGMSWCNRNRFYWFELKSLWVCKYNTNLQLFDPKEFENQYDLNVMLLGQNDTEIQSLSEKARSILHQANTMSVAWSEEEEVILCGAAMDRDISYLHRGGSGMFTMVEEVTKRSWISIKQQYDMAWRNAINTFPSRFTIESFINREPEALMRHYRLIWIRSLPFNQDQPQSGKSISHLSEEWYSAVNKDGILISKLESLAAKPDDRFLVSDVPEPQLVDCAAGDEFEFLDSILETWDNLVQRKKENAYYKFATPISVFSALGKRNCKLQRVYGGMGSDHVHADSKRRKQKLDTPSLNKGTTIKASQAKMWLQEEDIILYGILLTLQQWKAQSKFKQNIDDWEIIQKAFHMVRSRLATTSIIMDRPGKSIYSNRSWKTLAMRAQILQKSCQQESYSNYLRDMWVKKYNKQSNLLQVSWFDHCNMSKQLQHSHISSTKNAITIGDSIWRKEEEVILAGSAFECVNIFKRVSKMGVNNKFSDVKFEHEYWYCLKNLYDTACSNYIAKVDNSTKFPSRAVIDLGEKIEMINETDTKRAYLVHLWQKYFNKGNSLLSDTEIFEASLAATSKS